MEEHSTPETRITAANGSNVQKNQESSPNEKRPEVLAAIKSPLILYGLIVSVAEGVFGAITSASSLTEPHKFIIDLLLIALFFFVSTVVGIITFFRPGGLSPEMMKEARKAYDISSDLQAFINDQGFKDSVSDIVEESVKPDALIQRSQPKDMKRKLKDAE